MTCLLGDESKTSQWDQTRHREDQFCSHHLVHLNTSQANTSPAHSPRETDENTFFSFLTTSSLSSFYTCPFTEI